MNRSNNSQNQAPINFWDFRHKKIYINSKERLIDFFFGLILGPFLFIFLSFIFSMLLIPMLFKQISIPGWVSPSALAAMLLILFLIYTALRRKHIFYGMLAGIIIASIFFLSLITSGPNVVGGKDARRMADLRQVQTGLELYFQSNGQYPNVNNWSDLKDSLVEGGIGISTIPNDPLYPNANYSYGYSSDNQHYVLKAILEDKNHPSLDSINGDLYGLNCDGLAYCITL